MNKLLSKKSQAGFSLMEVLVFTAILSMFFVATATIVTYMLRTAKINEHKILATRYAEEVLEWMRAERDIDWNAFSGRADSAGSTVYCFNSEPPAWSAASCGYGLDSVFKRSATLTSFSASGYVYQVNVAIRVEWLEGGKLYTVPLNTTFAVLER
jgi:type II secretory pathway pseudopilin PulG